MKIAGVNTLRDMRACFLGNGVGQVGPSTSLAMGGVGFIVKTFHWPSNVTPENFASPRILPRALVPKIYM